MTCDTVHHALLERDLCDLADLAPHLAACPRCAARVAELVAATQAVRDAVDAFAAAGDVDAALARAFDDPIPSTPTRSWRSMSIPLAAAAVLALLVLPRAPTAPAPAVVTPAPLPSSAAAPEPPSTAAPTPQRAPPISARSNPAAPAEAPPASAPDEDALAAPVIATSAGIAVDTERCAALARLESRATSGKLDADDVACLEARFAAEVEERAAISTTLFTNAWAAGDQDGWARLAERHLTEVDASNPDLSYRLALYLARRGGREAEVVRWADQALAGRDRWSGRAWEANVYALYELRAAASLASWHRAEEAHSPDASALRAQTAAHAREWVTFAQEQRDDTRRALSVCRAADPTCGD